jgi:hydroxymethylbilane synthase
VLPKAFRIATRKSQLAIWQAGHIKRQLEELHPHLVFELVPLSTEGDRLLSVTLADFGGKGLFIKELEQALLSNQADIAVHSMKDVPMNISEGLKIGAICEREDPRDVFIANNYASLELLPKAATVGTSSLRRQCQLGRLYKHLELKNLRGNVDTRLQKLDKNEFDAIILAAAGIKRLGLHGRIRSFLPIETFIPAVGQGALGIECREQDDFIANLIRPLHHSQTAVCVTAERAMNERLGVGCHAPIAAYARFENADLVLRGMVGNPMSYEYLEEKASGTDGREVGFALGEKLVSQGALELLALASVSPNL